MNNKKVLYIVIVILVVVIVAMVAYFMGSKGGPSTEQNIGQTPEVSTPSATTPAPAAANEPLSEQPNQAKFDEYLSSIYLGKMAVGKKIGADGFPVETNAFTSGADQFCTMMQLKKTIPSGSIATAIYDTVAKSYSEPKTVFPMELKAGGSGGCENLTQSAGKYEYKLYIENVLVAVLPFEVK